LGSGARLDRPDSNRTITIRFGGGAPVFGSRENIITALESLVNIPDSDLKQLRQFKEMAEMMIGIPAGTLSDDPATAKAEAAAIAREMRNGNTLEDAIDIVKGRAVRGAVPRDRAEQPGIVRDEEAVPQPAEPEEPAEVREAADANYGFTDAEIEEFNQLLDQAASLSPFEARRMRDSMPQEEKERLRVLHQKFADAERLPKAVEDKYSERWEDINRQLEQLNGFFIRSMVNGDIPQLTSDASDGIRQLYDFGVRNQ
jgi:hypothetical protein